MAHRVADELGDQLRSGLDIYFKRAARQQLDALLPAGLESKIKTLLDKTQADWIASLKEKPAQTIEKVVLQLLTHSYRTYKSLSISKCSARSGGWLTASYPTRIFL